MKKKVIELLKSGDFTLVYHDSGSCTLYKGKHKYDDLTDEDGELLVDEFEIFGPGSFSYTPDEVEALVKALGGKVLSV